MNTIHLESSSYVIGIVTRELGGFAIVNPEKGQLFRA